MLGRSKDNSYNTKFEVETEEKQQLEIYSVSKSVDHPKKHKNEHNTFKLIKKEVNKVKYNRIKKDLQQNTTSIIDDLNCRQWESRIITENDFLLYNKTEQLKSIFDMCHDQKSAYNHAYESCMASKNGLRTWTNKHRHKNSPTNDSQKIQAEEELRKTSIEI